MQWFIVETWGYNSLYAEYIDPILTYITKTEEVIAMTDNSTGLKMLFP